MQPTHLQHFKDFIRPVFYKYIINEIEAMVS